MDKIRFEAGDFSLEMQATTYKNDPEFLNTNLWVAVECGSFAGAMTMDVGTMELEDFVRNMVLMNKDLEGSTRIEEPYGNKCFIEFEMGKTGHVKVCGKLIEGMQKLSFESCFDQTFLSGFVKQLSNADAWQEVKI